MKLSIIIPAYNEKNTIGKLLALVEKVDLNRIEKEIIIRKAEAKKNTWAIEAIV